MCCASRCGWWQRADGGRGLRADRRRAWRAAPEERRRIATAIGRRRWETRAGEIELPIPKLRRGSYFPSFLEPRRRSEQALVSVVQEAYVERRLDPQGRPAGRVAGAADLQERGLADLRRGSTSRWRRSASGRWRAATRTCGWTPRSRRSATAAGSCRKALVIAYGVHETGRREVIGLDVGEAETEAFWREFLRGLVARGLAGVQLASPTPTRGCRQAIAQVLGCPWQRCTVHFLRDCSATSAATSTACWPALIRPIFNADLARAGARARSPTRSTALDGRVPKVAELLEEAEDDLLAFYAFPADHWPSCARPTRWSGQPRDRPPHRRRRDLPQRRRADPARRDARDRAERRVAGRPPLPVGRVDGAAPRGAAPSTRQRQGGPRAPSGLSSHQRHRRHEHQPLTPRPGT